ECRDAVMAGGFVGDGHGHADIAIRTVSREGFLAIQDPVIAVQTRNSLSSAGVASRFGFGKTPRSEFLAFGQRHGELAALLFASEVEDVSGAERIVSRDGYADGAVHAGQLFDDVGVFHV